MGAKVYLKSDTGSIIKEQRSKKRKESKTEGCVSETVKLVNNWGSIPLETSERLCRTTQNYSTKEPGKVELRLFRQA